VSDRGRELLPTGEPDRGRELLPTGQPGRGRELLLTGATGFLGKVVLHDLLRRREALGIERVHAVVRPASGAGAEERLRKEVLDSPALAGLPGDVARWVSPLSADLSEPGALEAAADAAGLAPRLGQIVHCAASVEFDLPVAEAASANIDSALHVLELARRCPRLESMVSVSTAYVTPHPGDRATVKEELASLPRPAAEIWDEIRRGKADEAELLRETRHPNTYTLTKCLAEHLLVAARGAVPLSLVRPSIISASWWRPEPGWIDSPAAFALFVMAIGTGRMRAVVARPRARIDLVPCDEVAERVVDAAFDPPPGDAPRIWHAVAGYDLAIPAESCLVGLHDWFQRNPVTTSRQGPAQVHYLGPGGFRYRFHHWLHHLRRRDAHLVAPRLDETNRRFAYFTTRSFRFASSVPLTRPDFDPRRYLERISRGVAVQLLDADLTKVSLAGQRHPRAGRLTLGGVAAELDRRAEWVSFDLDSFERALRRRAEKGPRERLALAPTEKGPWNQALLALLARARPDLWAQPPHALRAPPVQAMGPAWDALRVRIEHEPARRGGAQSLGRFHLVCEGVVETRSEGAPRGARAPSAGGWLQHQP